jgi:hypothetical protein
MVMTNDILFDKMIGYHVNENLMPFIKNNPDYASPKKIISALEKEGSDEGVTQKGFLVIANGSTLVDRIKEGDFITDSDPPEKHEVPTLDLLISFIKNNIGEDGAFLYDGENKEIRQVQGYENNNSLIRKIRAQKIETSIIPPNFIYHKADALTSKALKKIGRKTDLAMFLPIAYSNEHSDVGAFQIKRSRFGPLGLGKVTYFKSDGLHKEFYFDLDNKGNIIGVTREYESGLRNFNYTESSRLIHKADKAISVSSVGKQVYAGFMKAAQGLQSIGRLAL